MQTIRVDDEVMRELQRRAYKGGLVFGSPNQALRLILELDNSRDESKETGSKMAESAHTPTVLSLDVGRRRVTGKRLLRSHENLPQDMRAYSDRDGLFYEWPRSFPAILFDSSGYIVYESEDHLRRHSRFLQLYPETRKINAQAHGGISRIPGYERCCDSHY